MGSILGAVSMVLGPALLGLALATLVDPWLDDLPNYATIDDQHGLLMLSFNLAAAAFPFAIGSVVAIAIAARASRHAAAWGLSCSVLGLSAMFGNAMLSVPIVLMNGIADHSGFDQLAPRLAEPPLVALWAFPLFFVGSVLLAVAVWRSAAAPPWAAVCIGLGGLFPVAIVMGVGVLALPIAGLRIAGSLPLISRITSRPATAPAPV
jgi:hypothetical protein